MKLKAKYKQWIEDLSVKLISDVLEQHIQTEKLSNNIEIFMLHSSRKDFG